MFDFNAHKALVASVSNPHAVTRLNKVPTSAMQRDSDGLRGLRIKCELIVLAALVGILYGCAL